MMQMKPEELRQLRAWAVETTIAGRAAANVGFDLSKIVQEAEQLVEFVRADP